MNILVEISLKKTWGTCDNVLSAENGLWFFGGDLPAPVWCQWKTYSPALPPPLCPPTPSALILVTAPSSICLTLLWLILKFIPLKNKIVSWRAEGCAAQADVIFHAGPLWSCVFSPPPPPSFIYLLVDLFFGAKSALYIMVAAFRASWCVAAAVVAGFSVLTMRYTSKAGMNNLALGQRENGIWRVIKLLVWLTYEHSSRVKTLLVSAKHLERKHALELSKTGHYCVHYISFSPRYSEHSALSRQL